MMLRLIAIAAATLLLGRSPHVERFHTRLVRSEPARDTVLGVSPADIRLWFSEAVSVPLTRITLRTGTTDVPVGVATRAGGAEAPVIIPVRRRLVPGRYVVRWTTASSDGHPVKGEFPFTVSPSK
jgi:methionine-rich copper-binding protein CopC